MDLVGDERAQSVQVGAVLLFAVLIVAFSSYQAFVVPEQNREIEFNHYQDTQADMEGVRNAVLNAGSTNSVVTADVDLATNYPPRLVAYQPQSSSGVLRSSTIGGSTNEITLQGTDANISQICGQNAVTTRSMTYRPEYNYLDSVEGITYENSFAYATGRQGGTALLTDQRLIDNESISLYPLVGPYDEGGSGVASVSFSGGTTGENASVPGDFTLTVPTELSASQWADLLSDEDNVGSVTANTSREAVDIELQPASEDYSVRCTPTGTGSTPENTPSVTSDDTNEINPAGPSDVALEGVTVNGGDVIASFNNTASKDANLTKIRMPFVFIDKQSVDGSNTDPYDVFVGGTERASNYEISDSLRALDPEITIAGNDTVRDVTFSFDNAGSAFNNGGFIVVTVEFSNGETGTYFLDLPTTGGGGQGNGQGNG